LIFFAFLGEKLLVWLGIEQTTLDLSYHSGTFDHSAMVKP